MFILLDLVTVSYLFLICAGLVFAKLDLVGIVEFSNIEWRRLISEVRNLWTPNGWHI